MKNTIIGALVALGTMISVSAAVIADGDVIKLDFATAGDGDGGSIADWNQVSTGLNTTGITAGNVKLHGGGTVDGVTIAFTNLQRVRWWRNAELQRNEYQPLDRGNAGSGWNGVLGSSDRRKRQHHRDLLRSKRMGNERDRS